MKGVLRNVSFAASGIAIDELRVSDIQRYRADFRPPPRDVVVEADRHTRALFRFEGDSEEIEVIPNEKLVSRNEKGIESTITWLMEGHGEDTDLTFEVEYNVPMPVLGKLAEKVVLSLNEHEADAVIANVKSQIEA